MKVWLICGLSLVFLTNTSNAVAASVLLQINSDNKSSVSIQKKLRIKTACYQSSDGQNIFGLAKSRKIISTDQLTKKINRQLEKLGKRKERLDSLNTDRAEFYKKRLLKRMDKVQSRLDALTEMEAECLGGNINPSPNTPPVIPDQNNPDINRNLPELARWESQMIQYGHMHCDKLGLESMPFDPKLLATYYDAAWVYYQIGDYTGDPSWYDCAVKAHSVYRDEYVLPSSGNVPGYWIFPHGLKHDALRYDNGTSSYALDMMAHEAAFARDGTDLGSTQSFELSREVAYVIMAYLSNEDLNRPKRSRRDQLVNQALDHLDQWFGRRSAPYVQSFMVGITAHALIMHEERTGDSRVLPKLKSSLDQLWNRTWDESAEAFRYVDVESSEGSPDPAPDLNNLIAPAYAWVYMRTGEARFKTRADKAFAGGVKHSWLEGPKQFNQNYRWSFEYVKWRSMRK